MAEQVEIFEVGPRDGLQNEKTPISTDDKVALVDLLSTAGFRRIEVASFVSPKWVPQMADSGEVLERIKRAEGVSYAALTPNMKGLQSAIAAKADEVAIFGSASEGFSKANLNRSISESFDMFFPVAVAAQQAGLLVRGYISCVTDCPFEGEVAPEAVLDVTRALVEMGCYEISLGDTIGQARPERMAALLEVLLDHYPPQLFAGHFHNTAGRAIENIDVALDYGLRAFDAAVGGLGGCPYAPGAEGNVATEDVFNHVEARGFETGLDGAVIEQAARMARAIRGV